VLNSNAKGNIAEAGIALEAIKLGFEVLRPVAEHGRYDLVLDTGTQLLRVQCKVGVPGSRARHRLCSGWRFATQARGVCDEHLLKG
jgi:PD-(D/E)XK endonuclease